MSNFDFVQDVGRFNQSQIQAAVPSRNETERGVRRCFDVTLVYVMHA